MLESPSHSDDDLLRLIAKGHEAAFVAFYRQHQSSVYRFALHMSGKTEIAEEVTQEVFLTVMSVASQYDSKRGSAVSYLYGITRNFVLRCLEREHVSPVEPSLRPHCCRSGNTVTVTVLMYPVSVND